MEALRTLGPLGLALIAAAVVDRLTERRGLTPPGLRIPWRRLAALAVLAAVFWVGVFASLRMIGAPLELDYQAIPLPQLFLLHALFVLAVIAWLALGFAGLAPLARVAPRQVGLAASRPLRELALGAGMGLLTWPLLLLTLLLVGGALYLLGAEELFPTEPPEMVVWIVGLPLWVKLAVALSAGLVEELFFRGFLQPRIGIPLSTLFFVLAHLSYDQPFMLIGITVLSLFFALLVEWRQNIWAAVAAHALFDLVQLLVVIPWALERWQREGGGDLMPVLGLH